MTTWENTPSEKPHRMAAARGESSKDGAWARLWTAITAAVLLAMAYPVYEYKIHAALAERDIRAATRELQTQVEHQQLQVRQRTLAERLAQVRVKGVSDSAGLPVVLVNLQGLRMEQAAAPICAQAEGWLKRSLGGTSLRIQSYRDDQPARDAGVIRCA